MNLFYPKQLGWRLILSNLGIDIDDFLPLAGLPNSWFTDGNPRCSANDYFRFWTGIGRHVGSMDAALKLSQSFRVESVDFPLAGAIYQSNGIEALEYLRAFYPIAAPFSLDLSHSEDLTCMTLNESAQLQQLSPELRSLLNRYQQMFIVLLLRCATRSDIKPEIVTNPYSEGVYKKQHEAFFGASIQYDTKSRIVFDNSILYQPLLTYSQLYVDTYRKILKQQKYSKQSPVRQ